MNFFLNIKNKIPFYDIIIFLFLWIFVGIISFCPVFIHFPDFDWFNYHFYNCWAFLNDRMGQDFLTANSRTCINPIIDIPEYLLLLKLNNHPYLLIFLSVIDTACLLFLVYKITGFIFAHNTASQSLKSIYSVLYIMFSPLAVQQLSFEQNDTKTAVLCLLGFYILLKNLFIANSNRRTLNIFLAGIIFGGAAGLKLSGIVYCSSILIICLILFRKIPRPFHTIMILFFSMSAAFILIDGFWLYKCFKFYHNPLFPYFNNIFKSEYADKIMLLDSDYSHLLRNSVLEYIFYPFYRTYNEILIFGSEKLSWDPRFAINFVCVIFLLPFSYTSYRKRNNNMFINLINYNYLFFVLLFSIVPFYVNLAIFGTYRYIYASHAVFGIIILIFIYTILKRLPAYTILITAILSLLLVYINSDLGDLDYLKDTLPPEKMEIKKILVSDNYGFEDNSYVIVMNSGASALVANQNPNAKYIGYVIPNKIYNSNIETIRHNDPLYKAKFMFSDYTEKLLSNIFESDNKIYIIYNNTSDNYNILLESLNYLDKTNNRKLENCEMIKFTVLNREYFWEPVKCEFNISNQR